MRNLIGSLLCLVGRHDWRYESVPIDSLAIGWTGSYRICKRCSLWQALYHDGEWR